MPPPLPPGHLLHIKYSTDILDDLIPTVHQPIREDNTICFIIRTQGF